MELDRLTNPITAKHYEESIEEVMKKIHESRDCEDGAEGMEKQCQAIREALIKIFGEEKADTDDRDERRRNTNSKPGCI